MPYVRYKVFFKVIDLTPANLSDIHFLNHISDQILDCTLLGDKGYLTAIGQLNLFESTKIRLDTLKRNHQKGCKPQFQLFRKS